MNIKETIRIDPHNQESLEEACITMLIESLSVPAARQLIEQMIADPKVSRRQLVHTAWTQGASYVLYQVMQGRVIAIMGDKN